MRCMLQPPRGVRSPVGCPACARSAPARERRSHSRRRPARRAPGGPPSLRRPTSVDGPCPPGAPLARVPCHPSSRRSSGKA